MNSILAAFGVLLLGAFLAAATAWMVNYFAPGLLDRLLRRSPLKVHIETDSALIYAGAPNWVGSTWVLPEGTTPEAVGQAQSETCHEWRSWMTSKGAYDGDHTELRVTLQGARETAVVVDGVRVIELVHEPVSGVCFSCPVGGADITPRYLAIDLDWAPGVVSQEWGNEEKGDPTRLTAFSLARGEIEMIHIIGRARTTRCQWRAELLLIVNGKRQTIRLDDDGQPFCTSTTKDLPGYSWWAGQGWR